MIKKTVTKIVSVATALVMAASVVFVSPIKVEASNIDISDLFSATYSDEQLKNVKLSNILVEVAPAGFHPSKGNYIKIKSDLPEESYYFTMNYTVNILNSAGKSVFKKTLDGNKLRQYVSMIWDGKGSVGNEAKYDPKAYVPQGNYTIEASAEFIMNNGKKIAVTDKKKKDLLVSAKAPSGAAGVAAAVKIPVYSSDDFSNYVLAKMCEKAGVNINMPEADKVKKLYQWEVDNFTHIHDFPTGAPKWDEKALAKEIAAFAQKTDKEVADGKAIKTATEVWLGFFEYQAGVCDHNAAAFKALLNQVGMDAGICNGNYLNRSGKKSPHAWNSAVVNGELRYFDVDVEIQNKGKTKALTWFNKTRAESNSNHEYSYEEIFG